MKLFDKIRSIKSTFLIRPQPKQLHNIFAKTFLECYCASIDIEQGCKLWSHYSFLEFIKKCSLSTRWDIKKIDKNCLSFSRFFFVWFVLVLDWKMIEIWMNLENEKDYKWESRSKMSVLLGNMNAPWKCLEKLGNNSIKRKHEYIWENSHCINPYRI